MFSTILDKVSSFFDRRALISAFFPSLIFWMLVVVMYVMLQVNWQPAVKTWDGLSITVQLLLLLAFFTWITFCSFLTINFRTAIIRLYEGYWSDKKPFSFLLNWRRTYWTKRWNELQEQDQKLKSKEEKLRSEKRHYNLLRASLRTEQAAEKKWYNRLRAALLPQRTTLQQPDAQVEQKLKEFLDELDEKLNPSAVNQQQPMPHDNTISIKLRGQFIKLKEMFSPPNSTIADSLSIADIQKFGRDIRKWWVQSSSWRKETRQNENNSWAKLSERLEGLMATLMDMVDQRLKEVQIRRQPLYRELSLYYPSQSANIMPTRLGNVLKTAELYASERYHLDSVLIWPRLQATLPDTFATPLQDAKTPLDLMITLSAFILLFGLPLSIWATSKAAGFLPWWVSLFMAIIILPFRLYLLLGLNILALILSFALPHPPLLVVWLQTLIILLIGVSFLSWLSYQNAVQAALNYGEQIKAAFDLYRRKVLEELHLQLPTEFEEEGKIWGAVDTLLAHGEAPDSKYYRYAQPEKGGTKAKENT